MSLAAYDESIESLKESFNAFSELAEGGKDGRGSKTKALQARKLSMDLANKLKDFRALSIENDKVK